MASKQWKTPPEMFIDLTKNYRVLMATNRGSITFDYVSKVRPEDCQ